MSSPAALPAWLPEVLKARQHVSAKAADVEADTPAALARATTYLRNVRPAVEGQGGDAHTYATLCAVRDLGVSAAVALELALEHFNPRCEPEWEPDELEAKVSNAFSYAQNEASAWAVESTEDVFGAALAKLPADEAREREAGGAADRSRVTLREARLSRFRGRDPDEYADLPELETWDKAGVLPKIPGGSVGVAYGASGVGKTTVILTVLADVIREQDARVLYLAGEGGYGLGKQRIPAVCEVQGITPRDLRGKLRLADSVPNLNDDEDTEALIEAQAPFKPHIVVVDTLATALPGADENAASTGSLLTGNGPAGQIRAALNAAVIFVAHSGKDQKKGIRGSSAFAGNVDFVWQITSDKEAGTARLHVEKMKDGPDGFSVHFRVSPATNGVPVARQITKAEYAALTAAGLSADRQEVAKALRKLGPEPVTTHVLASALIPLEANQSAEDHERLVKAEAHRLQRLARSGKDGALGRLAGYVAHFSTSTRDPMLWALPFADDDDGGDDE